MAAKIQTSTSRPHKLATWVPIAWTIGIATLAFVFALGVFYATQQVNVSSLRSDLNGMAARYNNGISELTKVIKEEALKRESMEKTEAEKREGLRKEYLSLMRDQTKTFGELGDKIVGVSTKVEVMGTRYEAVDRRLNEFGGTLQRVLEQTAPRTPGPPR